MIKRHLLDKLIDELNGIVPEDDHFNFHELQGFFHALAITPPPIIPEHWENCLFHCSGPDFELKHMENLMPAAFAVYDAFDQLRRTGELEFPYDMDQLKGKQFDWVYQWCFGFWTGLSLCKDFWLGEDADNRDADSYWDNISRNARLFEVLATRDLSKLANIERIKINAVADGKEPTDAYLFAWIFKLIPLAVNDLQHVADDIEVELEEQKTLGQPASRPKIGRNEPCPCGSGKKFKKCCLS